MPNADLRRALRILALFAALGAVGCTHRSLTRNTVLTTTTVMEIQYRSVLANLAMMSAHPEALPNHVHLADGVVQVNDRAGFGQAGGFTTFGGSAFGIEALGPSGQRQVSEQWGTDATTDPERLYDLQSLYRVALGMTPLPPSNSILFLRKGDDKKEQASSGGDSSDSSSTDGGGSSSSKSGSGSQNEGRRVPLAVMLTDVPQPAWYRVGDKKDMPRNTCYVGRWGDRYAWVTADGMPELARFTMTVLLVIKLKPGERGEKSGLAVTTAN